ncbi:hypothetical protein AB0C87_24930 [Actinomadura sp. NPDC048021]|uniref:hypothetical protein n=1 Tax=Actinomadura sp. NPDC048021 TaxID=3155385 RepID=UPI0033FB730F
MTERQNSEGGVFVSTEKIYDLLRQSIDQTNERMTEIRSDIRSMAEQTNENKSEIRDMSGRVRTLEDKLNKLPWTNLTAILAAAGSLILGYLKITGN